MPREQITSWTNQSETITSVLASDPKRAPGDVAGDLFKKSTAKSLLEKVGVHKHTLIAQPTQDDLDWAAGCGNFRARPSDLFLKLYANVLLTLESDPLVGVVSPPLLASTGTIPLSILSVIPDQMRHYANMIVRTEHECCIATNFLEKSNTAKLIANALRELSKRAEQRGRRVVVKFMYDRGSPKQMVENHVLVPPEEWPNVDLPKPEEMPNVDMQIVNYHRPAVGTFHTKMAVFDRKVALLSSCNMQDRVNVECTVHLEGDIVDSFYDAFLISFSKPMTPPLPLLSQPPPARQHHFGQDNANLQHIDVAGRAKDARDALGQQHDEIAGGGSGAKAAETHAGQVNDAHQAAYAHDRTADGDTTPACEADDATEASAQLGEMNLKSGGSRALARHLDVGGKPTAATTEDPVDDFNPHVLHAPHEPFPIAMVCRRPHGRAGHGDVGCPQDAAWLAGFAYAQHKVFIQTPTFNATDVVEAALETCKRGVEVTLWLDLGFNDEGEMIPMQGGTNEDVIRGMYEKLHAANKAQYLKVYWYVGKDQKEPLNAKEKSRNCHVKFASFDDTVAMVGNGNQDTQRYHSQEINVLVDSKEVIAEWHHALNANQNTGLHGLVDDDGVWRHPDGSKLAGLQKKPGSAMQGLTKGVGGAIKRLRGTGGF